MKKLLLCLLLLSTKAVYSDPVSDSLQNKLNAIRTMSASFSQNVNANQRVISHSTGTMALSRPGRFRWQTIKPMEQLVIADGEHLWIYDVALEQVTVKKQDKGVGGTAALFLSGYNNTVTRDFNVTTYTEGSTAYYDLKAKSNKANFQRVKLIFVGDRLTGLQLYDQLGQKTDVVLKHIKNNPPLASSLFKFSQPKGVDIVRQ